MNGGEEIMLGLGPDIVPLALCSHGSSRVGSGYPLIDWEDRQGCVATGRTMEGSWGACARSSG